MTELTDRLASPTSPNGAHPADGTTEPRTLGSIDAVMAALAEQHYIADRGLATALFLALQRQRPLLLEGEPGVGKTEVARVLAEALGTELIRLQCYEGIDQATAVYEWNYARQLLYIRAMEAERARPAGEPGALAHEAGETSLARTAGSAVNAQRRAAGLGDVFGPEFLIRRPLLHAIDAAHERPPVLLIDELDRADAEFEAYLLELLSDYAITIPELGTLRAEQKPIVILTSNRTRDIHDALRRRCLYYWIEYPSLEKEYAIVRARVPEAPEQLARQVVAFVQLLRGEDLFKAPGVAETLDWLAALVTLGQTELSEGPAHDALGALLKYQDDIQKVTSNNLLGKLVEKVRGAAHGTAHGSSHGSSHGAAGSRGG